MGCAPREHGALRRQRLEVLGDRKLVGVNGLTTQEIVGGRHDLQGRQSEIMGRRDTHGRAPKGELCSKQSNWLHQMPAARLEKISRNGSTRRRVNPTVIERIILAWEVCAKREAPHEVRHVEMRHLRSTERWQPKLSTS